MLKVWIHYELTQLLITKFLCPRMSAAASAVFSQVLPTDADLTLAMSYYTDLLIPTEARSSQTS
jgi:hypothetical protein